MTIITTQSRVSYNGDNVSTNFTIPFEFFLNTDVTVIKSTASGPASQTFGIDYTLTGAGVPGGGTLVKTTALLSTESLEIFLAPPIQQESHYISNSPFPAATLENDIDRQTQISQRLQDQISRTLRAPDGDNEPAMMLPAAAVRANLFPYFDASGNIQVAGNFPSATFTQTYFNTFLALSPRYAQTLAEQNAGIVPANTSFPPYSVMRYAADASDVADSTTAINTAFLAGAAESHAMVTGWPGAGFKISASLTPDLNKVGFDGLGCRLDCTATAMQTTALWAPIQSAADVNMRAALNAAHPIKNYTAQGPGQQYATAIAINLNDTASTPVIAGVIFENIGHLDFGIDIVFNAGAFRCNVSKFTFGTSVAGSSGPATTYSVIQNPATNSGELNTFHQGFIDDKKFGVLQNSGNADMELTGVSIDGCDIALNCQGGILTHQGGHIESSSDADNWVKASTTNAVLTVSKTLFVLDAAKTVKDLCYSDPGVTAGCLTLDDCTISAPNAFSTKIVGGVSNVGLTNQTSGNYKVRGLRQIGSKATVGYSSNLLAYGGFENANYASEWTLTHAVQSTAQAHLGTHSLQLTATTAGSNGVAVWTKSANPGDQMQGEFWYLFPTIATGGTLLVTVAFFDAGGNNLENRNALSTTTVQNTWTLVPYNLVTPAPPGTASANFTAQLYNVTAGTALAYLDDIIIDLIK